MALPGLNAKNNIPKAAPNSINALKAELNNASRVSTFSNSDGGSIFGIPAQRSNRYLIYNPRYKSNQDARMALNRRDTVTVNNFGRPKVDTSSNLYAEMMKQQQMLQSIQMFSQVLASAAETVKNIKSSNNDGAGGVKANDNIEKAYKGWSSGKIADDYNAALKNKSFTQLNQVETNIDKTVKDFSTDYKQEGTDTKKVADDILAEANVKAGLELAGTSLDTSKLDLSDIKLDEDKLTSFDDAARDIDKDIAQINDFRTKDISKAKSALHQKSNDLQTSINSYTAQIKDLDSQISNCQDPTEKATLESKKQELVAKKKEAEAQKENVDDADKKLDEINKQAQDLANKLATKKNDLHDIKKIKGEIADKKYELAKDLDKTAENAKNKLEKLSKEIDEKQKKGQNASDKITEFNGLVKTAKNAVAELKSAGGQGVKFKNAKGKEYQVKMADYTVPEAKLQASSTSAASKATPAPQTRSEILNDMMWTGDLKSCPSGKMVKIGDQTYMKNDDKFNSLSTPGVSYTIEQLEALKNEA